MAKKKDGSEVAVDSPDAVTPEEGCIFMTRDGQQAQVNENSIEIMEALGWVRVA